ncbi:uncharacterized protein GGS22DRAFT_163814 [Annulohypoxylon maeteangense]|uniref:uncharacterized protein n=1 Tax=Annulohypoxylon maeteangense TaxID=1927788 RepID=UPI0020075057|nr:uncharacterized protein GGS22DRAFT_163814 [Annulohypoxylon maeteangense]KAI0884570.1 hypothetical protein GGS22DRAFT_163814 [Annulohypoxylon maeteangense]
MDSLQLTSNSKTPRVIMAEDNTSISDLALLAERDPQQFQLRVEGTRSLEFAGDDSVHHVAFRGSKFPALERLVLDASDQNDEDSLKPYLQPALKEFSFFGGPISDAFLKTLQESSPGLEELLIDNPRNLISPDGFIRFLSGANALKRLSIMYGMDRAITDDVFVALSTLPNLQSLRFTYTVTPELVSFAKSQQLKKCGEAQLFPCLNELVCTVHLEGLCGLLPHLRQLSDLDATILSKDVHSSSLDTFLRDISTYASNLSALKLQYSETVHASIDPANLVHLAQALTHLQHMEISGDHIRVTGLGTDHFAKITQALPNLKVLRLAFQCSLSEAALVELSQTCGGVMTNCELWGSYALHNLEGTGVSLPALQELVLGKLVPPTPDGTNDQAVRAARVVKEMAPNLESFDVISEDPFSTLVQTAWKGLA